MKKIYAYGICILIGIVLISIFAQIMRENAINNQVIVELNNKIVALEEENNNLKDLLLALDKEENVTSVKRTIDSVDVESKTIKNYSVLGEYKLESSNYPKDAKVSLLAEVDEYKEGEYAWDDGQNWMLLLESSQGEFLLFDEYIQLGRLEVYLINDYNTNNSYLTTIQDMDSGIIIREYKYDAENNKFIEYTAFKYGNNGNMDKTKLF